MSERKGRLKINLDKVLCPECNKEQPLIRMPKNSEELLYGGWSCSNCGCIMDKFGNILVPKNE